jgi:hypothetical protein
MTRQKFAIAAVAALALGLGPVLSAQRTNPGGGSTGTAQPRGSGDSSGGSSSGSSSSSGSASSGSSSGGGSPAYEAPRAPSRPNRDESAGQRSGGGSSSGRAVPRGSSGSTGTTRGTSSSAGSNDNSGGNREAVPAYSRPRDGRNATGTAVERRGLPPGSGGGGVYYPGVIYDPYYYGYGYYDPYFSRRYSSYWSPFGYGYGLGYFAYDPYMFGSAYGSGYDPYAAGGYGSGSYGTRQYGETGSIRLKVKPNDAQVFIDGYYVGVVDSFDGAFQRLGIEAGSHKVEIRAEGYETAELDVMVMPRETVTYKGDLKRITK